MLYTGLKDFDIETEELATLAASANIHDKTFKIHVPKIMPAISVGTNTVTEQIKGSLFINDTSNRPRYANTVKTQGFITSSRFDHGSLIPLASPGSGSISKGVKIMVNVPGKNIKDIRVIGVK